MKINKNYNKRIEISKHIYITNNNSELRFGMINYNPYNDPRFTIEIKNLNDTYFRSNFELIEKEFPEFNHLTKWFSFSFNDGPLSYNKMTMIAEWTALETLSETSRLQYKKYFEDGICLRDGEELPLLKLQRNEDIDAYRIRIQKWLDDRLPGLIEDARKDLIEVGVIDP